MTFSNRTGMPICARVIVNHVSGAPEGGPRAHRRRGFETDAQTLFFVVRGPEPAVFHRICAEEGLNYQLIPLLHFEPSGVCRAGYAAALRKGASAQFPAGTGSGPDPNSDDPFVGHVLHGGESLYRGEGLCGPDTGGETAAEELLLHVEEGVAPVRLGPEK